MKFLAKSIVVIAACVIITEFVILPMAAGMLVSVDEEIKRREALRGEM